MGVRRFSGPKVYYKQYRIHLNITKQRLGRGVRKVIPSCAIWAIRNAYPESDDYRYLLFQEARDEINN